VPHSIHRRRERRKPGAELPSAPPPPEEKTTWEDITISFISDERVQVQNGTRVQTFNYAELGFADRRSGKPNQAWELLRALAETGGVIPNSVRNGYDFLSKEKQIQRLRSALKMHFGISSDPIPRYPDRGYVCRFTLKCAGSFDK
jgi:hypothetical protein